MIFDQYENLHCYLGLARKLDIALKHLEQFDFHDLAFEKNMIGDSGVYVASQTYWTKEMAQGRWESHKKYIDIQFMAVGAEKIGYTHISKAVPVTTYDAGTDFIFYDADGNYFDVGEKQFVIFFPHDVHKPSLMINCKQEITKIVYKIPAEH